MNFSTSPLIARPLSGTVAVALFTIGFAMATPASAAVCARGPYGSACVGLRAAAAAPHADTTTAYRARCYYRRGVRVCR